MALKNYLDILYDIYVTSHMKTYTSGFLTHSYQTAKKRLTKLFGTGETEQLNGLLNILNGLP